MKQPGKKVPQDFFAKLPDFLKLKVSKSHLIERERQP